MEVKHSVIIEEDALTPVFGFDGYFISNDDSIYKKTVNILKYRKNGYYQLWVNGNNCVFRLNDTLSKCHEIKKGDLIPIEGAMGFFINDKCRVVSIRFMRLTVKSIKYKVGNETRVFQCVGMMQKRNGKSHYYNFPLNRLIKQRDIDFNEKKGLQKLIAHPNYLIDKDGILYNLKGEEIVGTEKNGFKQYNIRNELGRHIVTQSVIDAQLNGILPELKRIIGSENYFIDTKGNVYNRNFKKLKPTLTGKGDRRYYTVGLKADGKSNKMWGRIIAENFLEVPDYEMWSVGYKDGNSLNCSIENIYVLDRIGTLTNRTKAIRNRYTYTKEWAIINCKCPTLLKYYQTGDMSIIYKEFEYIDSVANVAYWEDVRGELLDKVIDKVKRYSMTTPILKWVLSVMKYFNPRIKNRDWEIAEYAPQKVSRQKRITVDDMEFEKA